NSIINGSEGIAIGYASKMPSHNPTEVMNAVIELVYNPDLTVDELIKIMPGPDFPTGGELLNVDGIKKYYETGTGKVVVRGQYTIETLSRGKVNIIFHEMPFQVSAEAIIETIKKRQQNNKLQDIAEVRDLTDKKNGFRLVIETKAGTNYKAVINDLFK